MPCSRCQPSVRVDRELGLAVEFLQHALDPGLVLGNSVADLHLDDAVAAIEVGAHLGAELLDALAGIVVAARRVDKDLRVRFAAVPLGQQSEKGLAGDLGDGVPHRHVDRADRDRALAMASRLFVLHQRGPDAVGIEVVAFVVQQGLRVGLPQPRREPFADQTALAVTPVGVEAIPDDGPSVANDIGDNGDKRQRHLGKVDVSIGDRRRDRRGHLADIHNPHAFLL